MPQCGNMAVFVTIMTVSVRPNGDGRGKWKQPFAADVWEL